MNAALYYWRATRHRAQRRAVVVALVCGLLGMVALGGLAGARRTDTAYGRYLASINSSDVYVNVPGPSLAAVRQIERLPGVLSGAADLGLGANPVVHGRVDDSFVTDSLGGSLDGEYFRQDRATLVAGRLPRPGATGEIVLTPQLAKFFHTWVGGRVTYQFSRLDLRTQAVTVVGNSTFVVAAIADQPPVLVDQFDVVAAAMLPPAATARYLNGEFAFAWVGLRLRAGAAGIPALQRELAGPEDTLDREFHVPPGTLSFDIRSLGTVHQQVQQAIEPQAVALAIFGGLAALALLVLAGQALAQLLDLSAADVPAMRAVGATPAQGALAVSLDGAAAVVGGMALAVAGAVAISPLAPIGPVRAFDPARGFEADPLVLAGGGGALTAILLGILAVLAWRSVRPAANAPASRTSPIPRAAAEAGLPVTAVAGIRAALQRGAGRRPAGPGHPARVGGRRAGGGDGGGVRRQPERAGDPPGPVRLELDAADGDRGRVRLLAGLADGQARQRSAGSHRLVHLRVHPDAHRRPERAGPGPDPAPRLGAAADHQRPPDQRAAADRARHRYPPRAG